MASTPGTYIVTWPTPDRRVRRRRHRLEGDAAHGRSAGRDLEQQRRALPQLPAEAAGQVAARVGVKPRSRFEVGLAAFTAKMTPHRPRPWPPPTASSRSPRTCCGTATDDRNSVDFLGLSGQQRRVVEAGRHGRVRPWCRGRRASTAASGRRAPRSPVRRWRARGAGKYVPYRDGNRIKMTKSDGSDFSGTLQDR